MAILTARENSFTRIVGLAKRVGAAVVRVVKPSGPTDTGFSLDKYVLGRRLKGGNTDVVVREATHKATKEKVIVKIYAANKVVDPEKWEEIFWLTRVVWAASCAGAGVPYRETVWMRDHAYVVLRPFQGVTLAEYLSKHLLTLDSLATIFCGIRKAVIALHDFNIAHLNLVPENILVGENLEVRLCGLTNAHYHSDYKQSPSPRDAFAPIERICRPNHRVNFVAADIYTLGVLLYFIAKREMPFEPAAEEYYLTFRKWREHGIPGVPRRCAVDIMRMTELMDIKRVPLEKIDERRWVDNDPWVRYRGPYKPDVPDPENVGFEHLDVVEEVPPIEWGSLEFVVLTTSPGAALGTIEEEYDQEEEEGCGDVEAADPAAKGEADGNVEEDKNREVPIRTIENTSQTVSKAELASVQSSNLNGTVCRPNTECVEVCDDTAPPEDDQFVPVPCYQRASWSLSARTITSKPVEVVAAALQTACDHQGLHLVELAEGGKYMAINPATDHPFSIQVRKAPIFKNYIGLRFRVPSFCRSDCTKLSNIIASNVRVILRQHLAPVPPEPVPLAVPSSQ